MKKPLGKAPASTFWQEVAIFKALKTHIPWITFAAIVFGFLVDNAINGGSAKYEASTDILVQIDYQYTPLPTNAASDNLQVRVEHSTALNNEVRLLASTDVQAAAYKDAPMPGEDENPNAKIDLTISLIEGSSVIHASLVAEDREWAVAYLNALTKAYQTARNEAFSSVDQEAAITALRDDTRKELSLLTADQTETLKRAYLLLSGLRSSASLETQTRAAEMMAIFSQFNAVQPVSFAARAAEIAADVTQPAEPSPSPSPTDAELRNLAELETLLLEASELADDQLRLQNELRDVDQVLSRVELRNNTTRDLAVIAPPRASSTPIGLSPWKNLLLSTIVGFILASLVAIVIEGNRRARAAT